MNDDHQAFVDGLKRRLKMELPGLASQLKMVPAARKRDLTESLHQSGGKKAAVLICLFPAHDGEICFVLIKRNEYDGVHSGQISFPGGSHEEGDENLVATALREANEETGIDKNKVQVLGSLTSVYIPPSNFFVEPVVGWTNAVPDFVPDKTEVSEILIVPLGIITQPAYRSEKVIPHREFRGMNVPCFTIGGHIVWGATAMILSEMSDLVGDLSR